MAVYLGGCCLPVYLFGTAALEYDLAKEINGAAAATEIHRHELFGCPGEEMVQEMKPYFVDFPNVKNNCLRFEVRCV